jgi:hypothetical protein
MATPRIYPCGRGDIASTPLALYLLESLMPRHNPPRGIPRKLNTNPGHYVSEVEYSKGFWEILFAVSRPGSTPAASPPGNVTPDKAKGQQRQTVDLSAPRIPSDGTPGVDTKYSR